MGGGEFVFHMFRILSINPGVSDIPMIECGVTKPISRRNNLVDFNET